MKLRKNILVVDKDANVRRALRRALESDGYRVVSAADAQEAVSEMGKRRFLALLWDTNSRVASARETSQRFSAIQPNMNIIAMTTSAESCGRALPGGDVKVLLEKPLVMPCLIKLLKNLA